MAEEEMKEGQEEASEAPSATTEAEEPSETVSEAEGEPGAEVEELDTIVSQDQRIQELEASVTQLQSALEEKDAELVALREQVASAAAKYRVSLLAATPEIPEELVQGETVEEVEASLASARKMVEKVKKQLESQVASERVPAGAPVRSGPDLTALSPKEKIAYALQRR